MMNLPWSFFKEAMRRIIEIHEAVLENGRKLDKLLKGEQNMAADLSALQAQVAQNTQIEGSAITLIQGIAAQLAAAKDDPAAVQALVDQLNSSATALANAVTANTPPTT